ncbi:MAG: 6-phosphogluconolactonase [Arenicella sp.]|jgi:6-phosphogluconolactonase|nr:6-phosphogluconolactonase [bacterium]MDG1905319.1 6-phosphogluconolactonase [Arenicella sp.]HAU68395.1 6-phosphogluconolactonase [Gammaproteobacteria bacterium]
MTDLHSKKFELGEIVWHEFSSSQALALDLADELINRFRVISDQHQNPFAAFSGGSTPKPLFEALSAQDFDWSQALLTLVDERWVEPTHELSNHRFITEHFLSRLPEQSEFIPLYAKANTVIESLPLVQSLFDTAIQNRKSESFFDAVVLGMGGDGHTASFFPDATNVSELVTYASDVSLQTCISPASQVDRVTWSLARLLSTPYLVLHITGQQKRDLFSHAIAGATASFDDLCNLPIRSVAYQSHTPLHVYYAD